MAEIELRGISKAWGQWVGVEHIDLTIQDREFMVFLGPSGCGKTTTMRMIAGLEEPSSGEILIDGELVNDVEARDRDVAMVFQSYSLYPTMSIYENIRFPLKVRGVPKSEHDQRVRRAAELVELGDFLDRRPGKLSGGQRQRAALARAIVRDPQVFLMDEPLSNLDAKLRVQMRAQLKHLQHELQTTTIYVTHDQIEAMTLADRVAVMNAGRIQQLGTPDEVYNNPANMFVAGFIGSPPMNLIPGRLQGGDFVAENLRVPGIAQDPRDRGDSGGKGPSRDNVVLGIRSEDVSLAEGGGAHVQTTIYSLEPTGENTLVSCPVGDRLMVAKLDRDFRREINAAIALSFAPRRIFLFDQTSGERLETVENPPVEAAAV